MNAELPGPAAFSAASQFVRPEDVADAVVFLMTSDYITGQTVAVDGGRLLR